MHPQMLVVPFLLWRELVPLDAVPVYGDVLVVVSVSMTKSCHQISEIFVTNQVSQLHLPKATRFSQQFFWLSLNLTKFLIKNDIMRVILLLPLIYFSHPILVHLLHEILVNGILCFRCQGEVYPRLDATPLDLLGK